MPSNGLLNVSVIYKIAVARCKTRRKAHCQVKVCSDQEDGFVTVIAQGSCHSTSRRSLLALCKQIGAKLVAEPKPLKVTKSHSNSKDVLTEMLQGKS